MIPEIASPRSLTSRTYAELRSDILSARLRPGDKLQINLLQQRFSASLSVIREALSRLAAENLVDAIDQRGFRVSSVSLEDLDDLIRTRRQIEGLAIRQAIEKGDALWEAEVSGAYSNLARQDQQGGDWYALDPKWVLAHEAFHQTLIAGCESPWLMRLCAQFAERTQRYRYLSVAMAPHRDGPAEHKAITQAVLSRDADMAATVLDGHFATTQKILLDASRHLANLTEGAFPAIPRSPPRSAKWSSNCNAPLIAALRRPDSDVEVGKASIFREIKSPSSTQGRRPASPREQVP